LGRRRRKQVPKTFVRKIPKLFPCPVCGSPSVTVIVDKDLRLATIQCGGSSAGWCDAPQKVVRMKEYEEPIDAYCRWQDEIESGA